jgi:prepilin-type N-terminal cleavage/methylation domain-containing protein/prepilin-type processing-associated H-X9-DG protein
MLSMRTLNPCSARAFTLIELLVVVSILGTLAGLLLPALSRSKEKGRQIACRNNLHELGVAFQLYYLDFTDTFPAPGSKTEYGPQPEDWIWWQQDRDVKQSSIARQIVNFTPKLFTCPVDQDAQTLQSHGQLPEDPYRYSYSLTSYGLTANQVNPGMSTIITKSRAVYPFKSTQIRNPSAKVMLVEEDRKTINDPRWVPVELSSTRRFAKSKYNLIASRHSGKGDVIFADTHVEAVTPQFGQNPTNSMPTY